jgi:hypothetical protein
LRTEMILLKFSAIHGMQPSAVLNHPAPHPARSRGLPPTSLNIAQVKADSSHGLVSH